MNVEELTVIMEAIKGLGEMGLWAFIIYLTSNVVVKVSIVLGASIGGYKAVKAICDATLRSCERDWEKERLEREARRDYAKAAVAEAKKERRD